MVVMSYLQMLREIKSCAMATVDNQGNPRIRIIDVMLVEDEKLYFCTARGKDFYQELITQKKIAITGLNPAYQTIRLHGEVYQLANQKYWIDRIFEENPVMKEVYPGNSRYILEPFCVEHAQLEFFDLSATPINREYQVMGTAEKQISGYVIQRNCIDCGKCLAHCPQDCILPQTPYKIQAEHCLHCGLCYEQCPVHAIQKGVHL